MASKPDLELGLHTVAAECPRCKRTEAMMIVIDVNLVIPRFDTPSLKLKARSKALDHDCRQTTVTDSSENVVINFETGEIS